MLLLAPGSRNAYLPFWVVSSAQPVLSHCRCLAQNPDVPHRGNAAASTAARGRANLDDLDPQQAAAATSIWNEMVADVRSTQATNFTEHVELGWLGAAARRNNTLHACPSCGRMLLSYRLAAHSSACNGSRVRPYRPPVAAATAAARTPPNSTSRAITPPLAAKHKLKRPPSAAKAASKKQKTSHQAAPGWNPTLGPALEVLLPAHKLMLQKGRPRLVHPSSAAAAAARAADPHAHAAQRAQLLPVSALLRQEQSYTLLALLDHVAADEEPGKPAPNSPDRFPPHCRRRRSVSNRCDPAHADLSCHLCLPPVPATCACP
jgi:hypothetical protein